LTKKNNSSEKAKFEQSSPWKIMTEKIISLRNLDLKALTNSGKWLQIVIGVARFSTLNTGALNGSFRRNRSALRLRLCLQYLDLIAVKTRVFFGTSSFCNMGTDLFLYTIFGGTNSR